MIMSAHEDFLSWEALKGTLQALQDAIDDDDYVKVRQLLRETVSGYAPDGDIVDWKYQQQRYDPRT